MPLRLDDDKLLEKYKTIWTKYEGLLNIKLNALPIYNDRYIKTKIRTSADKFYTNFCGLIVLEDDAECESFTIISIDSLLAYDNKFYLQVYLDNYAYKIVDKKIADYLHDNLFETVKISFLVLINGSYKSCITQELIYVKKLILPKIIPVRNVLSSTIDFLIMV